MFGDFLAFSLAENRRIISTEKSTAKVKSEYGCFAAKTSGHTRGKPFLVSLVTSGKFKIGTGKRGHYERGLFIGGISRISKISIFSRISRKWSDSPFFSTVWRFSTISNSLESLEMDFSEKTPFPKDPFFRSRQKRAEAN